MFITNKTNNSTRRSLIYTLNDQKNIPEGRKKYPYKDKYFVGVIKEQIIKWGLRMFSSNTTLQINVYQFITTTSSLFKQLVYRVIILKEHKLMIRYSGRFEAKSG